MIDYSRLSSLLVQDLSEATGLDLSVIPSGVVPPEASHRLFSALQLRGSFYKKLAVGSHGPTADEAAERKFFDNLPNVGLKTAELPFDDYLLDQFTHNMWCLLEDRCDDPLDLATISELLTPGPGKSLDQADGSFFEKYFQGPLSVTSDRVLALFRACLMHTPVWALAEKQRFEEFGVTLTDTSKGFFAQKNVDESRFCATEPGINMLFQLAIGRWILSRLQRHYGISLSDQKEKNMSLAQAYSMTDDGSTVDQTSASDSISVELVDKHVPPTLRGWLKLVRTTHTLLPKRGKVALPMISTMGNGFTFPLQCAIFACIVRTSYQLSGLELPIGNKNFEWGVFGDDVIVPSTVMPKLKRLLHLLGFKLNVAKTFESGPFRESCGGDFFAGSNVRGVYIRSLETGPLRFSAVNRLLRWSAYHGIPLTRTIAGILGYQKGWRRFLVPPHFSDDSGIHVPSELSAEREFGFCALEVVPRKKFIGFDSPEYLGYNLALYVSFLGSYAKSRERELLVESDFVGPLSSDDSGKRFTPQPLEITYRLPQGTAPSYRKRTYRQYYWWWDYGGVNLRDDSWNAVVSSTLSVVAG